MRTPFKGELGGVWEGSGKTDRWGEWSKRVRIERIREERETMVIYANLIEWVAVPYISCYSRLLTILKFIKREFFGDYAPSKRGLVLFWGAQKIRKTSILRCSRR
jgi:hypothetical protein